MGQFGVQTSAGLPMGNGKCLTLGRCCGVVGAGQHQSLSEMRETKMSLGRQREVYGAHHVRQGLMHFLLGRGMAAVFGFAAALLLVRFMPIKDYAVFATLTGLQIVAVALAGLGLDQVITRYVPEARVQATPLVLGRLVWLLLALRAGGLALVIVALAMLAPWVVDLFNIGGFETAYWLTLAYTALFGLSQHVMRSLQALMAQRAAKWAQFWEFGLRLVLIAAWSAAHAYVVSVVEASLIFLVCALVGLVVLLTALTRHLLVLTHQGGEWAVAREDIYRMGWHNYLQNLLLLPTEMPSMRLVAAYFLAPPAMAAYGFFLTLTGTVRRYLPIQLLLDLAEPVMLAKYAQSGDFRRLVAMTNTMFKVTAYLLVPLIAWMALLGGPVVGLLTGGKYEEYAWMLAVLLAALLLSSHWIMLRTVCNAVGMSGALAKGALASLAGLVPLLMLLSMWPLPGVFVIGSLVFLVLQTLLIVKLLRGAGHPYAVDWGGLGRIGVAAALVAGAGWGLLRWCNCHSIWGVVASGGVMAPIYLVLVRWLRAFGGEEREMLGRINRRLTWLV